MLKYIPHSYAGAILHKRFLEKSYTSVFAQLAGLFTFLFFLYVFNRFDVRVIEYIIGFNLILLVFRFKFGSRFFKEFNELDLSLENFKRMDFHRRILGAIITMIALGWSLMIYLTITKFQLNGDIFPVVIMLSCGACSISVIILGTWPMIYYLYTGSFLLALMISTALVASGKIQILGYTSLYLIFLITMFNMHKVYFEQMLKNIVDDKVLKEHNETLNTMFDSLQADLIIIDSDDRVSFTNNLFINRYKIQKEKILGSKIQQLKFDSYLIKLYENFKKSKDLDLRFDLEVEIGPSVMEWHQFHFVKMNSVLSEIHGSDQRNINDILVMSFSIQELKTALIEVERQKNLVLQSARMASIGEMSGGIAHEINNPLAIVQAASQQLQKQFDKQDQNGNDFKVYFEKMDRNIKRISGIIKALKIVSRDSSLDSMKNEVIGEIVFEVISLVQDKMQAAGIKIDFSMEDEFQLIFCHRIQLEQVLINLFNNAHDAISHAENPWIRMHVDKYKDHLRIIFTDSGNGIPKHVQDKIMTPFFTTKEPGKGMGLGLSISHSFIQNHKGKFYIDNGQKNTTFVIELPIESMASVS